MLISKRNRQDWFEDDGEGQCVASYRSRAGRSCEGEGPHPVPSSHGRGEPAVEDCSIPFRGRVPERSSRVVGLGRGLSA